MSPAFAAKKRSILLQLSRPADEYNDLSPKGSIDQAIRALIDEINAIDGLVTTSSCAGRISAFLEGRKKTAADGREPQEAPQAQHMAGPGGKGGGQWLFVSHDPLAVSADASDVHFLSLFGLGASKGHHRAKHQAGQRNVHLKFEPMILHLLTASLDDAQKVLSAALQAGFRESGAVGLARSSDGAVTPMVAVRSIGLTFDSVVGHEDGRGQIVPVVDEAYLRSLVELANERFVVNAERIDRFRSHLLAQYLNAGKDGQPLKGKKANPDWEDPAARRERKRAEGLETQQSKVKERREKQSVSLDEEGDLDNMFC